MKRILLFLAKLIIVSLVLLPVMPYLCLAYKYAVSLITTGAITRATSPQGVPYNLSWTLYPFLVLILATPKLNITRRVLGITGGIAIYMFIDSSMCLIWKEYPYVGVPNPTNMHVYVSRVWVTAAHWFLPFILWLSFAFRQIEQLFKGDK